ncbi:MAG: potassium channel protein [Myxococcales bacterium]|nr:potassium channel protein [Myxococcales bacterium]MDD9967712.1 potassium channel protein [Myxococcales bacterium]
MESSILRSSRHEIARQLAIAASLVAAVIIVGTAGYNLLGQGRWSVGDCLYMTVITLSTVGFAETLPDMNVVSGTRLWTTVLIFSGSGSLLFFVSTFTAFIVEGDIQGALRRRRMQKEASKLEGHMIIVGAGATGIHVVEELYATEVDFVVIDIDEERLLHLWAKMPSLRYVHGDATDDEILQEAGITRARGLATTLRDDKDNVFVSITARALNPDLKIVAKVTEDSADMKMRRAGANTTVSPSSIGGLRIASELVRPSVVRFLDTMLRDRESALRVEELPVPTSSHLVGSRLGSARMRDESNVLVLAVRGADGEYTYNPGADFVIEQGATLIVLCQVSDLPQLRSSINTTTSQVSLDGAD